MTIATYLQIGGVALAVLAAAPYLLPAQNRVERSALLNATPAEIYKLLNSSKGFQAFNPYKDTDPALKITFTGPEQGIGSGFAFEGKEGKGTQTITHLEENRAVTMQIDLGAMGQPEQTFALKPADNGTQVTWGINAKFGMNPIGRVFGLLMDRIQGKTIERGLNNLSRTVGQKA